MRSSAAYKIKEAMAYIRNPGALVDASTRPRQRDESDSLASLRDTYFVPLERMQKTSSDFSEFEKMQLLCQVYFGPEAGQPFERVKKARHTVWVGATMLLQTAGERDVDRELKAEWRGQIWEGYGVKRTTSGYSSKKGPGSMTPGHGGRGASGPVDASGGAIRAAASSLL